jgi:hypothetical protein
MSPSGAAGVIFTIFSVPNFSNFPVCAKDSAFDKFGTLKIVKMTPAAPEGLIGPGTSFSAEFSRELDVNTVNDKFISLSEKKGPVRIDVRYQKSNKTVLIRPLNKLSYDGEYRLVFKTGIADKSGKRLPTAIMYQYSTLPSPDKPPIKVIDVSPRNNSLIVEEKPLIYAAFDQKMAAGMDGDMNDCFSLYHDNEKIPVEVRRDDKNMRLEARPMSSLKGGLQYRAVLSRKIKGENGKCLVETHIWSFKTAAIVFFLKYTYPGPKASAINSFDRILLTFSESLNPRTSFDDFINIVDDKDGTIPGKFYVFGTYNVIFIPDLPFYTGAYKIIISKDLKSLSGNEVMKDLEIPFTVKSDYFNSGEFSNVNKNYENKFKESK